jgi:intein/homing endonuclease
MNKKDLEQLIENRYLGLPDSYGEKEIHNALLDMGNKALFDNNPVMELLDFMRQPENFYYTCKWLLNIHLLPLQCLILHELWTRKFPMLIASRGASKCVCGDSFIQLNDRFAKIGDIIGKDSPEYTRISIPNKCFGENGYSEIDYGWNNGVGQVYKTCTKNGLRISGVPEHKIRVVRDGQIEWVELQNIKLGDYACVSRDTTWHSGTNDIDEEEAYMLGCLVGDGGYTLRGQVSFSSADSYLIEKWNKFSYRVCGKYPKRSNSNPYDYVTYSTMLRQYLFSDKIGFNSSVCGEKDFPSCMYNASKKSVAAFIRGLIDTDGMVSKRGDISFCSKSRNLVVSMQHFLLKFGVVSQFYKSFNKIYQRYYYHLRISGVDTEIFNNNIGIGLERKRKRINSLKRNTNQNIIPKSLWLKDYQKLRKYSVNLRKYVVNPFTNRYNISYDFLSGFLASLQNYPDDYETNILLNNLKQIIDDNLFFTPIINISLGNEQTFDLHLKDNHSFITNGFISHNSFLLSLYALLRAVFCQSSKIIVVGSGFRQSKIMFEYMEQFWRNAPILRHMIGGGKQEGPKRDIDRCVFYVGDSSITAIPVGCLAGSTLVTTNNGIKYIKDVCSDKSDSQLLSNGEFRDVGFYHNNGVQPVKKITTKRGYEYTGTYNHKMKVVRYNKITWCRTDELQVGDYILIDRKLSWWPNPQCPYNKNEAYELGQNTILENKPEIPSPILSADKDVIASYLKGIFTYGCEILGSNSGLTCRIHIYNLNINLLKQIQYMLLHFGIVCRVKNYDGLCGLWIDDYYDIEQFYQNIGFGDSGKHRRIEHYLNNIQKLGDTPLKYSYKDGDIYYDIISTIEDVEDCETYDVNIPDNNEYRANGFFSHNTGEKIRGLRSNYTLADEFHSLPQEIFEVVIRGFSSVSANPVQRAKDASRIEVLKSLGMYREADEIDIGFGNQIVISGTAYYSFNHFYNYWLRYKQIIESNGEKYKLEEVFKGEVPDGFNWKDFSIIRLPWNKLPSGFMDQGQIHQAKATTHVGLFNMEYGAVFARDSNGFFKRSLIEKCVCQTPIDTIDGAVQFSAVTRGNPNSEYVYGIDPASEHDNFAIVVLEVWPGHRRIVYLWSVNRQKLRERIKGQGQNDEKKSFYAYCARKIRDLIKIFPTRHIGIDTQGGGITIMETLHDPDECRSEYNENLIWPYIKQGDNDVFWWEKADKPTDGEAGQHILHMVQFANADFTRDANHGLRQDFEQQRILLPFFDSVTLGESISLDKIHKREYDTLEDCVMEIEELKDELTTIMHDQTPSGRDRWDTPEVKLPGNKKGRLRKDRYSALLIANMVARVIANNKLPALEHKFVGGFVGGKIPQGKQTGSMYIGPEHIISKIGYGKGVIR